MFILITTIFFALTLFISFSYIRNSSHQALSENLVQFATIFHSYLELGDIDNPEYLSSIKGISGISNDFRISIVNSNRFIVNSTRESMIGANLDQNNGSPTFNINYDLYSAFFRNERVYYSIPLDDSDPPHYFARYSISTSTVDDRIDRLTKQIVRMSVLVFILMALALWIISGVLSRRLNSLIEAASEVAKGNFGVRLHFESNDELKVLADSFNDMTSQIKFLFDELNSEKQELKTLMESMQEALCVIDENDKVVYANDTFQQLVNQNNVFERSYWEFLRDSHIDDLVKKIRIERNKVLDEINIFNKVYLLSGQFFPNRNQTILLFSDISEIKTAEAIKKNLVSNVSHELRTPLTSIRGFVETLKSEETDPEHINYLEIIERNTSRLENIVKDLLELSSLEDGEIQLTYELIEVGELVKNVIILFESKLKEKDLKLTTDIQDDLQFEGDYFKMEQVLINLIDNAVKYTEQGEVTVRGYSEDARVMIEVSDTGYGIPPRYQTRIFERFYVVDKSRSRKQGGTGLGLSIVKNIVILHNGEIHVDSQLGEGTTFKISLPLKYKIRKLIVN